MLFFFSAGQSPVIQNDALSIRRMPVNKWDYVREVNNLVSGLTKLWEKQFPASQPISKCIGNSLLHSLLHVLPQNWFNIPIQKVWLLCLDSFITEYWGWKRCLWSLSQVINLTLPTLTPKPCPCALSTHL